MKLDRRRRLYAMLAGGVLGALVLPERWVRPVVQLVILPAHAEGSPVTTTTTKPAHTTTAPSTTTAPGTTTASSTTTAPGTTAAPGTTTVPSTTTRAPAPTRAPPRSTL